MYPISYTMKVKLAYFLLGVLLPGISHGLIFREDQFTDMMQECLKSDGKPLLYILNANNPAMYVSVDNNNEQQQFNRKIQPTILIANYNSKQSSSLLCGHI